MAPCHADTEFPRKLAATRHCFRYRKDFRCPAQLAEAPASMPGSSLGLKDFPKKTFWLYGSVRLFVLSVVVNVVLYFCVFPYVEVP